MKTIDLRWRCFSKDNDDDYLSWCKGCHIGDKGDGDVGQYTDDDHDSYLQGEC